GWGFGDFFIQKSTRKIGDWETLFLITAFGAIVLLPFVYKDIPLVFSDLRSTLILLGASIVLFLAALLDLQALKEGKLAVVEPLWSWEIPMGAILAYIIFNETISFQQIILIVLLIAGLFMISLRSLDVLKRIWVEKAAFLAISSATIMGAANFLIGWGARETSPLIINWVINIVVALLCFAYLTYNNSIKEIFANTKKYSKIVLGMCVFDNIAWVAFAYAMVFAPIAIAVALSESYIIIVVLLGIFVNKEHLKRHQKIGLCLAVITAIYLATIS
ncbi:MAG TPA: EamA family transporter, partial [Candidatus Nanoarchaeia archaeon]|nr:EamA family transporter [Candidatus Nanoarchaeia archaeon]